MDGRKRTVQIKFRVTEAERDLILEKMKLVPTRNMAAYLRDKGDNDVLHHHFKGLSMLLIHGKEETGQHDGNHSHRRKAGACAVFEQKEKRQAEQESRRKTYNLPFGKVERYFCLDFG